MTSSLFIRTTQRFLLKLGFLHGRVDNQIAGLQIDFWLPVWHIFIFKDKITWEEIQFDAYLIYVHSDVIKFSLNFN
jgi:hypothetical protein